MHEIVTLVLSSFKESARLTRLYYISRTLLHQSIKKKFYRVKNIEWKLILRCSYALCQCETTANNNPSRSSRKFELSSGPYHHSIIIYVSVTFSKENFEFFFFIWTFSMNWLIIDNVSQLCKIIIRKIKLILKNAVYTWIYLRIFDNLVIWIDNDLLSILPLVSAIHFLLFP